MKYIITRTYYKQIMVEADSKEEARELADFDDVNLVADYPDEVEEVEE